MTYDQLQEANALMSFTEIKGKKYAQVNQRIKAFRRCYPDGAITTDIKTDQNGRCVFVATIYAEYPSHILGTGTAYENEDTSYINKTSYIENCETSAVGRALGMCGFGIDTAVASAEEVSKHKNDLMLQLYLENLKIYAPRCEDCKGPILPLLISDGSPWNIETVIHHSEGRFGRKLCAPCQKKAMKNGE